MFLQALPLNQLVVPEVVVACTKLHNICLGVGDAVNELMQHDAAESRGSSKRDKQIEIVYTI